MQPKLSQSLRWYLTLSVLLHLLGMAGALQYLRLASRQAHVPAPVRVTAVAPELPATLPPAVEKTAPVRAPDVPHPVLPHADPPAPVQTASAPAPPLLPLAAVLAARPPAVDLQPLRDVVPAPLRVPELTTPARPQPTIALAPVQPPQVPTAALPPPLVTAPEPVAPPVTPPTLTPAWWSPTSQFSWEVVTTPQPSLAQLAVTSQPGVQPPPPVLPSPTATAAQRPDTLAALPAPTPLQKVLAPSPLPPVSRRQSVEVSITAPPRPPVEQLPAAPPAASLQAVPPPLSPPAAVPPTAVAREVAIPLLPPPPVAVAALPPLPNRAPQAGGSQPHELAATPKLVQPPPGPSVSPRLGVGSPTPFWPGRSTFDRLPYFVSQPEPVYPLLARERGWEGTVVLHIELLATGTVGEVKVAESSGYPILDNAARDAVQQWRHLPTKRNGVAVTEWATLPVRFRLN